jgi:hypothetical protein
MQRRKFIKNFAGLSIFSLPVIGSQNIRSILIPSYLKSPPAGPKSPLTIYDNWSAYDELSDNIPLTEALAMKELRELIRLKKAGVRIDYYVMDAFWFEKWGGYRSWDKKRWPEGPDAWIRGCRENDIKPGMWFSTNLIATQSGRFLEVIPEWTDSLATDPNIMCLFEGGYLKHLSDSLQFWVDQGVGLFKFDFAYFNAVTSSGKGKFSIEEIEEKNKRAFMTMLKQFRQKNPSILFTGYNGFGGDMEDTETPFRKTIDHRWLEVFDTLYCGDPRFSDVPTMNIWRSQDIYSDHMVRQFEFNELPLYRIDNCAFMIGTTGTCYYRALNGWKGELILSLARGGWVNAYHGNLELLTDKDSSWFAKAQELFYPLQASGRISTFGSIPGQIKPYGFLAQGVNGSVCTFMNPSQTIIEIEMPVSGFHKVDILYSDGGFLPSVQKNKLTLGPEQLVVLGTDEYSKDHYKLGLDENIHIPSFIEKAEIKFQANEKNCLTGRITPVKGKNLRILFRQFGNNGLAKRIWAGGPPDGKKMDSYFIIVAKQSGKSVPVHIQYDKVIWSGLSWAAGEILESDFNSEVSLDIQCISKDSEEVKLKAEVYFTEN